MAKINVSGLTIKDIMNLDFNQDISKLTREDLSALTSRLVSASNKRIRGLAKTELGKMSPAYVSRMERGGLFSVKGKGRNELEQVFVEAKGFLELKTSSRTGWKNVRTEVAESLGVDKSFLNTETKSKRFWKAYREIVDGKNIPDKSHKSRYNSERIQELLAEKYGEKGGFRQKRADVVSDISDKIDKIYEEEQMNERGVDKSPEDVEDDETEYTDL